jgi:hypothetical protein
LGDSGIRMTQDHGSPGAHVVEEFVAVYVKEVLAFAPIDDQGVAAYRTEGTDGAVHAADEDFFRAGKDFAGVAAVVPRFGGRSAHDQID